MYTRTHIHAYIFRESAKGRSVDGYGQHVSARGNLMWTGSRLLPFPREFEMQSHRSEHHMHAWPIKLRNFMVRRDGRSHLESYDRTAITNVGAESIPSRTTQRKITISDLHMRYMYVYPRLIIESFVVWSIPTVAVVSTITSMQTRQMK